MQTQQEKLKRQIIAIVQHSGLPVRAQNIADRIAMPEGVVLSELLTELISEGRLTRGYTLLANGDTDMTYI